MKSNNQKTQRGGSVVLITALSLTVLAGCAAIAVDYGLLVADANRLQRACDSGALAGAQLLKVTGDDNYDTYQARTVAVLVVRPSDRLRAPSRVELATMRWVRESHADSRIPIKIARTTGTTSANSTMAVPLRR